MDTNMPLFFEDKSSNLDHELLLDYFLGWTLRCSNEKVEDYKVKEAAKRILSFLIYDKLENFEVISVETWKQWNKIDLSAEVILTKSNTTEKYAILFENKMYTHVHSNQLNRYKEIFEKFYSNPKNNKTDYKRIYVFLTCFYNECDYEVDFIECKKHNYKPYSFGWLKTKTKIEATGNYLFDEFWFRYW